jgi:hypothetical protein
LPTIGGADGSDTGNFNTICGNTSDQIDPDTYPNNYIFTNCDVIGETGPAGGLIFYDKGEVSDGWRYLEAAPSDQTNTTAIIAQPGHIDSAAQLCNDLVTNEGGYAVCDDWFLPSKEELNLMYTNLHDIGTPVGGFADSFYWGSSEYSASIAWYQNFLNGSQNYYYKYYSARVRAVRAF